MTETLAARGWSVDRAELAVPDWLDGRTVVHAVRLRPAAA
jgi:hypothetical protein